MGLLAEQFDLDQEGNQEIYEVKSEKFETMENYWQNEGMKDDPKDA